MQSGRPERHACLQGGGVRIVTFGTSHDHAPALPAVEPLPVSSAGPGLHLAEMTLGAQLVGMVQRRAVAGSENQEFRVLGSVAGGAGGAGFGGMDHPELGVRVGNAGIGHHQPRPLMARGAGIAREVGGAEPQLNRERPGSEPADPATHGLRGAESHLEGPLSRTGPAPHRVRFDRGENSRFPASQRVPDDRVLP